MKIIATLREKLTPDKAVVLKLIDLGHIAVGAVAIYALMRLAYFWGTLAR